MKIEVDLTKVQSLKPIPDGTYLFRIMSCKQGMSQTNNPKYTWEADILKPENVVVDGATVKKYYFDTSLAEGALFHLRDLYEACGKLKPGASTEDLLGCEVGAVVILTVTPEYGERNKIQKFIPAKLTKPGLKPPKKVVNPLAAKVPTPVV